MLKIIGIIVILVIGFIVLSLWVFNRDVEARMKNRTQLQSIEVHAHTIEGVEVTNSLFKDKAFTMVNIWATYCPSCIKELSDLQEIYEEEQIHNMGMLGIVLDVKDEYHKDKEMNQVRKILKDNNVKYPNILADYDFRASISDKVFNIPTTVFVNSEGKVISEMIESAYTKEQYKQFIKQIVENECLFNIEKSNGNMRCGIDGKGCHKN